MQRRLDEDPSPPRSRSSSRRNSASLSRRSSIKKEKEVKGVASTPTSATSTPKKMMKAQNLEFLVTGKQLLKRTERANSLPGSGRRTSIDIVAKTRRAAEMKRLNERLAESQSSKETSLEDDMSLDLSQVSDFEDTNSKYGIRKFQALATSTPKAGRGKSRSGSLQNQIHSQRVETRRALNSAKNSFSNSRDSFKTTSTSGYRHATDLDYSSVSPEYSGLSSTEVSPRSNQLDQLVSPQSQDIPVSSCCVSSWADCSETDTKVERVDGEWSSFWANYNNSLSKVPMKNYYDQCPTPYRTETLDLADFGDLDVSDTSRRRSPDNMDALNHIIRNQGLHLTPRETQNIIKCAHLLGNVLTKAIERRTRSEVENPGSIAKKNMTLDLKETVLPLEIKEEKKSETVTTQTDISLPNTKSAPRIFENILRQLSRSSIDVSKIDITDKTSKIKGKSECKDDGNKDTKESDVKDVAEIVKDGVAIKKDVVEIVRDVVEIVKDGVEILKDEEGIKKVDENTNKDEDNKTNMDECNLEKTEKQEGMND